MTTTNLDKAQALTDLMWDVQELRKLMAQGTPRAAAEVGRTTTLDALWAGHHVTITDVIEVTDTTATLMVSQLDALYVRHTRRAVATLDDLELM